MYLFLLPISQSYILTFHLLNNDIVLNAVYSNRMNWLRFPLGTY